ncbi:MAG: baeRF10 domain-containing protein [Gaiellaceae bacterium]
MAVRTDLERIDEWWEVGFERDGALGFALFASSADDLWRTIPVPMVVADDAWLGGRLRLRPLVEPAGDDHEGALVSVVSKERVRIFQLHAGRLDELLDRVEKTVDALHGGWTRPEYERHLESLVHRHLKAVAADLDRSVRAANGAEVVVVAPDELRGELQALLSAETRGVNIEWVRGDDDATPAELLETVRPLLAESRRRRRAADLDRWRAELGRRGLATAGWEETLDASADARVRVLFLRRTASRTAYRCPSCERPAATAGLCVLDGVTLVPDDGVELAIRNTLIFGGTVELVDGDELEAADGIGALLRF